MSDSKEQHTKIKGDGNTVNNELHFHKSNSEIKIPYEDFQRRIELERKDAIEEHKKASDAEKVELEQKIAELDRRLADVPKAFEELQKRNAELEELVKHGDNKAIEKKFQKAVDAFKETDFTKADKILIEVEENEQLTKKEFGDIAYARGNVAEQEVRWNDAAKHYARSAQLDPCFETLISAQRLSHSIGDYNSALSLAQKATKAAINEHGEDSKQYARSISNLALIHMDQKKYKLAEPLHKESLKIRENIFGKKSPEVAESLNNLGGIYLEQEQYREATYFLRRALNISKESLGLKHYVTATILNNLGSSYRALGEFKKAKPFLKQALKIRKEILRDNHPDIANSYNNLGGLYSQQGQYKKADPYFWQALEILETTLGPDHPHTILVKGYYEENKKHLANTEKTRTPIKPLA